MTTLSLGAPTADFQVVNSGSPFAADTLFPYDTFVLIPGPRIVWVKACGCLSVRASWCPLWSFPSILLPAARQMF